MPEVLKNFIVVEGTDGSGKSALVDSVCQYLSKNGQEVYKTREPSDGDIGKYVRSFLRHERNIKDALQQQYLYLADRVAHLADEIMPALYDRKTVVCDRYIWSTIAYGAAGVVDIEKLVELNQVFPLPELLIFIDLDPEISLKRKNNNYEAPDYFERLDLQIEVRKNYLSSFGFYDRIPIKMVDGAKTKDEVFQETKHILMDHFG